MGLGINAAMRLGDEASGVVQPPVGVGPAPDCHAAIFEDMRRLCAWDPERFPKRKCQFHRMAPITIPLIVTTAGRELG